MRKWLLVLAIVGSSLLYGQSKMEGYRFNQLTEIKGTEYFYASYKGGRRLVGFVMPYLSDLLLISTGIVPFLTY